MADALHLTLITKNKLIIDAAIQIYNNNLYRDFTIDSVWDGDGGSRNQVPQIDVDDQNDPVIIKIDEIISRRLKEDVMYLKEEFGKIGIELDECPHDPLKR